MHYFRVFNKKGENELTRIFRSVGTEMLAIIRKEKKISDVMLMMKLEFNPETWRHWRAKFIELFQEASYTKIDADDENDKERIVYDKKQKLWSIQDV